MTDARRTEGWYDGGVERERLSKRREEMTKSCTSALIVAKPGPLRDSLQALIAAMPQIEAAYEVNDLASALEITVTCCPTLVLLDCGLNGGDSWMVVRRAKAKWPEARCVFLANDAQQHQEAEAAGADAVLLKGFPAAGLVATIVGLLPQQVA
jgi:DNA-binding NarL/FixJ family response regulator